MKMELLPDARPVKVPPHHLSAEDEQMIEEELGEMAANGFVERIRDPKWVFPFFVVRVRVDDRERKDLQLISED